MKEQSSLCLPPPILLASIVVFCANAAWAAAPAIPTGFTYTPLHASAYFDWDDNTEPDLDKYKVYRSVTPGGLRTCSTSAAVSRSKGTASLP